MINLKIVSFDYKYFFIAFYVHHVRVVSETLMVVTSVFLLSFLINKPNIKDNKIIKIIIVKLYIIFLFINTPYIDNIFRILIYDKEKSIT